MKWKYSSNERYMQEHIREPVNRVGHGGFLQDISITLKTYSCFGLKIGI